MRKLYLELKFDPEEWSDYVDVPDELILEDTAILDRVKSFLLVGKNISINILYV